MDRITTPKTALAYARAVKNEVSKSRLLDVRAQTEQTDRRDCRHYQAAFVGCNSAGKRKAGLPSVST